MSLTYAIGDIHGCFAELKRLLDAIEQHANGQPYRMICLGDYPDKGPDTAGALDLLMSWSTHSSVPLVCIKGNHDDLMGRAADDEVVHDKWLAMGGGAVLAQYGVRRAADLPADILAWLRALPLTHDDTQRYFVHAGVDPAHPLDDQDAQTCMTMRGVFLSEDHDFGRHIVHGHTPQLGGEPELRPFRSNLDTNVTQTGRLTAASFDTRRGGPTAILATTAAGGIDIRQLRREAELS